MIALWYQKEINLKNYYRSAAVNKLRPQEIEQMFVEKKKQKIIGKDH